MALTIRNELLSKRRFRLSAAARMCRKDASPPVTHEELQRTQARHRSINLNALIEGRAGTRAI